MQELCKVLIIDDCEEDCAVYQRYLQKTTGSARYEISVTSSAKDALLLCKQESFDVILLDHELPEYSGLEFLSWPKSSMFTKTAIIMLSAFGDEKLAVQALKQGAQDYLVKQSLTADSLAGSIRAALNQVRLKQQLRQTQERQQLISRIALKIRNSLELSNILETSVVEIRQLLKCDRVLIFQQTHPGQRTIVAESVSPDHPAATEVFNAAKDFSAADASETLGHEHRDIQDISSVDLDPILVKMLESLGVVALLEVPISIETANASMPSTWGALVLHDCQARTWEIEEQGMLQELSIHLAIAIQQSELLTQTQCALQKEQELNHFKSKIIATVSHEYRTPITSILASSATLERHFSKLDTDQSQRLLSMISEQARHLRELVNDMLVVNQVELGQIQLRTFPLNIEHFFKRLIEQYQVMAQEGQDIKLKIEDECQVFQGDFGLCRQIFGNLLSNAIKYSPDGSPINISVHCSDQEVTISIQDQGIGIPEQDLPTLFQSFTRGSNVDTIPGTGLGLSIAQACVKQHQGSLSINSQQGVYTKATVRLPIQPQTAIDL